MSIDPRDYEIDDEERERREQEFDRLAAAAGDKRPELPGDLSKLMWEILDKRVIRMGEPDEEPYMFGRFEAFDTKVGGMGMVLEARDPQLDRKVAIKLWQATGPGAEAALLAEAKILAKLSHPNVVSVHETGKWRDRVYFVMEWVDGHDGHEWLQQPRTWEEVQEVFVGAGEGLAAVHDAGIFHQDFKPANLLIARTGRVLVADFGIADMLRSMVGALLGQPTGTLPYMAPERLRGERGGARSDQFSFCVALWEALHGFRPFSGNTREELLDAIESNTLRGDPRSDRVPLWLSRIAVKGLDPDPDGRFDDMHELVEALIGEPPVSGQLDAETTVGGPKNTKRRLLDSPGAARHDSPGSLRRRWPWVAAGFGVGVAFALGMVMAVPEAEADECEEVMSELAPVWNNEVQAELRGAFGTRKVGDALQGWASRWLVVRAQECEAAKSDLRDTAVTPCTATVRERFEATVRAFRVPHLREGLHVAAVIAELPDPEHCVDHPDDTEWGYGGLLELRDLEFGVEVLVGIGDLDVARARQNDYMELAWELRSEYGIAQAIFWRAEIYRLEGQLDDAAQDFELAFGKATGIGMGLLEAEVQLKLAAIAGARGEFGVMDAFALGARGGFVDVRRPERIAELLQVQGLALVSGPESGRERGVALLLRAVEMREAELVDQPMKMRELLSQAHENYARGLLAVHRASEALEYLDLALTVHQEESGHGAWRTRGILRQKFEALLDLRQLDTAESVERLLLESDRSKEDWRQYVDDALWLGASYLSGAETRRATKVLRAGRARAIAHEMYGDAARFDRIFDELGEQ